MVFIWRCHILIVPLGMDYIFEYASSMAAMLEAITKPTAPPTAPPAAAEAEDEETEFPWDPVSTGLAEDGLPWAKDGGRHE